MSDVVAIVEGQTEQTFVRDHLAVHLGGLGIDMWSQLPGRVARCGGVRPWPQVRDDLLRTLKERPGRICTTMFDFYGMPKAWPGRTEAGGLPLDEKGNHVEEAILVDLANEAGDDFRRELFIPYVQVHEFEALLFADVAEIAKVLATLCNTSEARLRDCLKEILDDAGQAEAINDNYDTCPSRRIKGLVPAYSKPTIGSTVVGRIGLDVLRTACPHFGQWLESLESLAPGEATACPP